MTFADSTPPTRIELPAHTAAVQGVLDFCVTFAGGIGFSSGEQNQLRLALEEVIGFFQAAGAFSADTAPLFLSFETRADGIALRVTAKGLPLDTRHMPDFRPGAIEDETDLDGLGLFLAKQSLNRLDFSNRGSGGIEAVLYKTRSSAHAQNILTTASPDCPPAVARDVSGFTIRPAREDEALEIARCAWMTYGYTYEDFIYSPDRIVELNRNGELRSLVAVTVDNEVMGHVALKCSPRHHQCAELGVLFVRPEFRRHGLGLALWQAATRLGRELGLHSIFARSVTGHRASQVVARESGFHDTALALALFPDAVDLKQINGVQQGKMSAIFQSIQLQPPQHRHLFIPERYHNIAAELFRRIGIPFTLSTGRTGCETVASEPLFHLQRIPTLNIGIQEIEDAGVGVMHAGRWLEQSRRLLCREKLDVIYLYINAWQASAAILAESAAQSGYVFSGIIPNYFLRADAIAMQYLNLPCDPFSQLITWTDTARLLRSFIETEWRQNEPNVDSL